MANMFSEEELQGTSPYAKYSPNEELEIGDSFCFYFKETSTATSSEYGEFTLMNGVTFDCDAKDSDSLKSSYALTGFVPNTLLLNRLAAGQMRPGNAYRIEKAWNRGDKYNGNQKAKGYGYKVFKLGASDELLSSFDIFIANELGIVPTSEEEVTDTESKPKVRI